MADPYPAARHDRRTFLLGAVAFVTTACLDSEETSGPNSTTAPADDSSTSTTAADTTTGADATATDAAGDDPETLTPAMFDQLAVCTLLPASTAGPFPSRELLDRREIHEGYPGHPLRLGVRVVDRECRPLEGALVEIWHTDASGDYSSYQDNGSGKDEGEGTTFCRGVQETDGNGILDFLTIYPGWYEGRAVHIHTMVHVEGEPVLTTQLYFDEAYTDAVYSTGEYAQFGPPDTSWASDFLIGDPTTDGTGIVLSAAETEIGPGSLGLINLGVDLANDA